MFPTFPMAFLCSSLRLSRKVLGRETPQASKASRAPSAPSPRAPGSLGAKARHHLETAQQSPFPSLPRQAFPNTHQPIAAVAVPAAPIKPRFSSTYQTKVGERVARNDRPFALVRAPELRFRRFLRFHRFLRFKHRASHSISAAFASSYRATDRVRKIFHL